MFSKILQFFVSQPEYKLNNDPCNIQNVTPFVFGNLSIVADNYGVLRVQTRAAQFFNLNEIFPILLPPNHRYSELIIIQAHNIVGHMGFNSTIDQVRQRYWLINIRSMTNVVIKKCSICKLKHMNIYDTCINIYMILAKKVEQNSKTATKSYKSFNLKSVGKMKHCWLCLNKVK